jgi:hypothetical protein
MALTIVVLLTSLALGNLSASIAWTFVLVLQDRLRRQGEELRRTDDTLREVGSFLREAFPVAARPKLRVIGGGR